MSNNAQVNINTEVFSVSYVTNIQLLLKMYISPAVKIIVCPKKAMSEAVDLKLGMS